MPNEIVITEGEFVDVYNYLDCVGACGEVQATFKSYSVVRYGVDTAVCQQNIGIAFFEDIGNLIRFVQSADRGGSWEEPSQLSDTGAWQVGQQPKLTYDPSAGIPCATLYCTWGVYNSILSEDELRISKSVLGGGFWNPSVAITNNGGHSYDSNIPAPVVVDSEGRVFVAWANSSLYVAVSEDGGATWPLIVEVDNTSSHNKRPDICIAADDRVYVCIEDAGDARVWRSDDHGGTWNGPFTANPTQLGYSSDLDSVRIEAGTDGNVYVLWYDYDNYELYYAYSADLGVTWSLPGLIIQADIEWRTPDLQVCTGSELYVIWEQSLPVPYHIHLGHLRAGGDSWEITGLCFMPSNIYFNLALERAHGYLAIGYALPVGESDDIFCTICEACTRGEGNVRYLHA